MAVFSFGGFVPSVFAIIRYHRVRPGRTAIRSRLIGSIRQECLDHVVVFGERHLRHLLLSHMDYYNTARTHLHGRRTRLSCALCTQSDASNRGPSKVDCIINMSGFDLR